MLKKKLTDISNKDLVIAPSLLAADFANLKSEIEQTKRAGVEVLHIDVMDGHFVPNISMGVPVVQSIRSITDQIFDVHLMISHPLDYVSSFVKAGADHITFHIESDDNVEQVIKEIKKHSVTVGMSLKPGTDPELILPYLGQIDMILVMTVEPGFGGQSFMVNMMPKISFLREKISKIGSNLHIEVDGGIDQGTVGTVVKAGANVIVAGTSVFKYCDGVEKAVLALKSNANYDSDICSNRSYSL